MMTFSDYLRRRIIKIDVRNMKIEPLQKIRFQSGTNIQGIQFGDNLRN